MTMFIRAKRVTDPLDDRVKAQLRGEGIHRMSNASSGSEHDGEDPSSISGFVRAFIESDGTVPFSDAGDGDDVDTGCGDQSDDDDGNFMTAVEKVKDILDPKGDLFRLRLLSDVSEAAESLRYSGPGYRRAVMGKLRMAGYNAGLCKAKWGSSGGLTAGSYEYIDVVAPTTKGRYVVDLEFAAEFEVARATEEYGRVVVALPRVLVGRPEEVLQVVRVAAKAARRSLRSKGLGVPPWRKERYMVAKWLGPYRRTVNILPSSSAAGAASGGVLDCRGPPTRVIGFQAEAAPVFSVAAAI